MTFQMSKFTGIGLLYGDDHLESESDAKPVVHTPLPVPVSTINLLKKELIKMTAD